MGNIGEYHLHQVAQLLMRRHSAGSQFSVDGFGIGNWNPINWKLRAAPSIITVPI